MSARPASGAELWEQTRAPPTATTTGHWRQCCGCKWRPLVMLMAGESMPLRWPPKPLAHSKAIYYYLVARWLLSILLPRGPLEPLVLMAATCRHSVLPLQSAGGAPASSPSISAAPMGRQGKLRHSASARQLLEFPRSEQIFTESSGVTHSENHH